MIVRLTGGLANQLFMYAFGKSLALRRGVPVQFVWQRSTWDYALDLYNTKIELVPPPTSNALVYDERTFAFDNDALNVLPGTYMRGYWQSEKYFFQPEVWRQDLTLREPVSPLARRAVDHLNSVESVFIHVRRGDYLNPGTAAFHGNLGHADLKQGYYADAIEFVKQRVVKPEFYVFSDDPQWCRDYLPYPVISMQGFSRQEDLYVMSQCRHGIMANSTFGWWANWLGDRPGRVVVAPKKWFNAQADLSSIIPERWTRL